jgi:hypothetical protein
VQSAESDGWKVFSVIAEGLGLHDSGRVVVTDVEAEAVLNLTGSAVGLDFSSDLKENFPLIFDFK